MQPPADAAGRRRRLEELAARNWSAARERLLQDVERAASQAPIDPRYLMARICEALPSGATVLEEGLTSTTSLLGLFAFRDPRAFMGLASGGIGFAMAGAVGASLALPERRIVAVVGDGSAMYSVQALWTAAHLKLPVTYIITNNRSYRILKERLVALRGTDRFVGMDLREPEIDFVGLAQSLGVPARRVTRPGELRAALAEAMRASGPCLVDVLVADGFGS
jgi:benzoylformate decarboxylase